MTATKEAIQTVLGFNVISTFPIPQEHRNSPGQRIAPLVRIPTCLTEVKRRCFAQLTVRILSSSC